MADAAIILDQIGNDRYAQNSREYLTNPILADKLKVLLNSAAQLDNIIKIRNFKSFGSQSIRDISLRNYVNATNRTNLIIEIPLNPPVLLDGQTYFETDIEANSEIDLMFYFRQFEISELFQSAV
jgi:hypothetical protein